VATDGARFNLIVHVRFANSFCRQGVRPLGRPGKVRENRKNWENSWKSRQMSGNLMVTGECPSSL